MTQTHKFKYRILLDSNSVCECLNDLALQKMIGVYNGRIKKVVTL